MVFYMFRQPLFASLFIGYASYVYVRRSVTFALPAIAATEDVDKGHLGLILSGQMLAYSLSKFVCGIVLDSVSPKLLFCLGLLASSVSVIGFAVSHSSIALFSVLWFINGLANGPGWPSLALILKQSCSKDQFGSAWSVISTSSNIAGTLGPLITAYIVTQFGWRTSLLLPGVLSVLTCFLVWYLVVDPPGDTPAVNSHQNSTKQNEDERKQSKADVSIPDLFRLPGYTESCLTYGVISLIQYSALQWGPLYLVQYANLSIVTGNSYISSLEVGGILGSVAAGFVSDFLLSKNEDLLNHMVRRTLLSWYMVVLSIFLVLFVTTVGQTSSLVWINFIGFGLGFTIYGPIALSGIIAMEMAPTHHEATAHAVTSLFSSGGQTLAGLPVSYSANIWGWQTTFMMQTILVVITTGYTLWITRHCMCRIVSMETNSEDKTK